MLIVMTSPNENNDIFEIFEMFKWLQSRKSREGMQVKHGEKNMQL